MGCVKDVVGKNSFVPFESIHKREMIASSLLYECEKEGVVEEVVETISDLPRIVQGELLNTNGDHV